MSSPLQVTTPRLSVHSVQWSSLANGPGDRSVVWTQGCTLGCRGCFNPETHAPAGEGVDVDALAQELASRARDGVTLTGGEPFQQWAATAALLRRLRTLRPSISVLVFSGYTLSELRRLHDGADDLLALVDVLIAGRYVEQRSQTPGRLLGSSNQQVHLLSDKHTRREVDAVPVGEVIIGPDGTITVTGVAPPRLSVSTSPAGGGHDLP